MTAVWFKKHTDGKSVVENSMWQNPSAERLIETKSRTSTQLSGFYGFVWLASNPLASTSLRIILCRFDPLYSRELPRSRWKGEGKTFFHLCRFVVRLVLCSVSCSLWTTFTLIALGQYCLVFIHREWHLTFTRHIIASGTFWLRTLLRHLLYPCDMTMESL